MRVFVEATTEKVKGIHFRLLQSRAEYVGLQESTKRALRHADVDRRVIFELDSQLVARQVVVSRWKAACRSPTLRPHFRTCAQIGHALTERGVHWSMYHIYREYNATGRFGQ